MSNLVRSLLLALLSFGIPGWAECSEPLADPPVSEQARLRGELRRLEQAYGLSHPKVLAVKAQFDEAVKAQLVEQSEPALQGLVLVHTRTGSTAVTLRNIRVLPLAGRQFLVGSEVKSEYTKGAFIGKQVWIPVEEVTQMVELGDAKPEPK